jgi:sulfonate dioxygenase
VFFRDQDLNIDQQYELTKHYGIVRLPQGTYACLLLMWATQQDRDPHQVDPRHVTIIGRDE